MEEAPERRAPDGQVALAGRQLAEPGAQLLRPLWLYHGAEVAYEQRDRLDSPGVVRPVATARVEFLFATVEAGLLVLDDFIILPSVEDPRPRRPFQRQGVLLVVAFFVEVRLETLENVE